MHDIVGKTEWLHMQNVEQLHAHDCYQNVTDCIAQPQTTE